MNLSPWVAKTKWYGRPFSEQVLYTASNNACSAEIASGLITTAYVVQKCIINSQELTVQTA